MKLTIIDKPVVDGRFVDMEVGSMWRVPEADADGIEAWYIKLPDGTIWGTTMYATGTQDRWKVTGEAPNITVEPSINTGGWHGFIRNGELVDA